MLVSATLPTVLWMYKVYFNYFFIYYHTPFLPACWNPGCQISTRSPSRDGRPNADKTSGQHNANNGPVLNLVVFFFKLVVLFF